MWYRTLACCSECGKTDSPHMAKGLCNRCYLRQYRNSLTNKARIVKQKRAWFFRYYAENLEKSKQNREARNFGGNRQAALKAARRKCARCGSRKKLTVHHKDRKGRGSKKPNNRLSNLEVLCRKCHLAEHRQEILQARRAKHLTPQLNKSGRWSIKHDACVACNKTWSKHAAKGLCTACYQ